MDEQGIIAAQTLIEAGYMMLDAVRHGEPPGFTVQKDIHNVLCIFRDHYNVILPHWSGKVSVHS